jgi:hypothetical protein
MPQISMYPLSIDQDNNVRMVPALLHHIVPVVPATRWIARVVKS